MNSFTNSHSKSQSHSHKIAPCERALIQREISGWQNVIYVTKIRLSISYQCGIFWKINLRLFWKFVDNYFCALFNHCHCVINFSVIFMLCCHNCQHFSNRAMESKTTTASTTPTTTKLATTLQFSDGQFEWNVSCSVTRWKNYIKFLKNYIKHGK